MAALDPNEALFAHLRTLHERGRALALLTNNVREWEPLWRTKLPVDDLFEPVVDSAFVGLRKPDRRSTRSCSSGSACPQSACVFVDDLAVNIEAARALGFATVHFRDTAQAIAELDALAAAMTSRSGRSATTTPTRSGRPRRRVRALGVEAPLVDALRAAGDLVRSCRSWPRTTAAIGHVAISRATRRRAAVLASGRSACCPSASARASARR